MTYIYNYAGKALVLLLVCLSNTCFAQTPTWAWATAPTVSVGGNSAGLGAVTDANGNIYVTGYFYNATVSFGAFTLTNAGGTTTNDIFLVKYSSTGSVLWAVSAGGTASEAANGIAIDASGNIFLTGYYKSSTITFGSTTLINAGAGTEDVFVAKYSSAGVPLWASSAGGSLSEVGLGIATDPTGNVLVTGRFSSPSALFGASTLTSAGSEDIFTVKYTSSGAVSWASAAGGSGAERGVGIATDPGGNVYITGYFSSASWALGSTTLTNTGTSATATDLFVAKYTGAGAVSWAVSSGGSGSEQTTGIATDGNSNVYITGSFNSTSIMFGITTLLNNSSAAANDYFISKYSTTGASIWAQSSGGADAERGMAIAVDVSGNVFTTGTYSSASCTFGPTVLPNTSTGTNDLFIVKYSSLGTVVWAVSAGGNDYDNPFAITLDALGSVYVSGWSQSPTITFGSVLLAASTSIKFYAAKLGACTTAPSQPGAISGTVNACSGSSLVYSVAAVTGASSYTWTLPTGWAGTSTNNTITATAGTTGGNITVSSTNSCGTSSTQTLTVTVSSSPSAVITAAGPVSFCQGGSVVLNVASGAGLTYQWKLNGTNITGATNASYTANASGSYTVVVTGTSCASTSAATTVTVSPLPTVAITQAGNVLTAPAGFSSYKWYKNAVLIAGATASTYTATQSGSYYVIVTNTSSCSGQSNTVGLTVGIEDIAGLATPHIYPNPNNGSFTISVPFTEGTTYVTITDVAGKLINSTEITAHSSLVPFNVAGITAGLYFITIKNREEVYRTTLSIK